MITGNNNDDLFLQFLISQGHLVPEEERLARHQQYIDTLRKDISQPLTGQMVGETKDRPGHYVAPGWGEYVGLVGKALMARHGAKKLYGDDGKGGEYGALREQQTSALTKLRDALIARSSPTDDDMTADSYWHRVMRPPTLRRL